MRSLKRGEARARFSFLDFSFFFPKSEQKNAHKQSVKKKNTNHTCERKKNIAREREREKSSRMSGVTTRAQKRRMGQRDLWDVIVNNDDVCFEHILPRLNGTDIKFLYDVNTETRALIKRSSRKKELKIRFKVSEMSSISTLEIAWENQSFWLQCLNKRNFCTEVARTNKLELLKWAREEKKCEWDKITINCAALKGNLEMVKYCVAYINSQALKSQKHQHFYLDESYFLT